MEKPFERCWRLRAHSKQASTLPAKCSKPSPLRIMSASSIET